MHRTSSHHTATVAPGVPSPNGEVCHSAYVSVAITTFSSICRVLDEDRDLAEAVPAGSREQATRECLAREVSIPAGRWQSTQTALLPGKGIGLLVLRLPRWSGGSSPSNSGGRPDDLPAGVERCDGEPARGAVHGDLRLEAGAGGGRDLL